MGLISFLLAKLIDLTTKWKACAKFEESWLEHLVSVA